MRVLVRGAGGPAGLNLITCLRDAGYITIAEERDRTKWAHIYRAGAIRVHEDRVHVEGFDDTWAVIPCPDELALVEAHQGNRLSPPHDVVLHCQNKLTTATTLGTLAPARATLETEPVWVRSAHGAGTRYAYKADNLKYALDWEALNWRVAQWQRSEYLPGPEYAEQLVYWKGKLVERFQRQRLEPYAPQASPTGVTSSPAVQVSTNKIDVSTLAQLAVETVSRPSLPHGVFGVDMRCSARGKPRVTEINAGRFFTTSTFPLALGVNLPDALLRASLGYDVKPTEYETGRTWVRIPDQQPMLLTEKAA